LLALSEGGGAIVLAEFLTTMEPRLHLGTRGGGDG